MLDRQSIIWKSIISAIPDVDRWNRNMPRLVKDFGPAFKTEAQAEAVKRGYRFHRKLGQYVDDARPENA